MQLQVMRSRVVTESDKTEEVQIVNVSIVSKKTVICP